MGKVVVPKECRAGDVVAAKVGNPRKSARGWGLNANRIECERTRLGICDNLPDVVHNVD
jgi:hypothetical protein